MTEVIMPKMGDGMEEGTLIEWLKKEGDKVKSGEVIGTIQTDKATLELESPGSGFLRGVLIQGGETVPVGVPIAALLKDGESLPEGWGKGASTPAKAAATVETPVPSVPAPSVPSPPSTTPAEEVANSGRVKASPLAKKIAAASGIDLHALTGSGPGGRIVEKDVRQAIDIAPSIQVNAAAPPVQGDVTVPVNKLRQITAKRTAESKQQVPHFYVTVDVDVERILELRNSFAADGEWKPSVNDFIVKACALALREMPVVNSTYGGDHLIQHGSVNIGIAVALDDGLTVPVMHGADQLTLREISARAKDLGSRAKSNKLSLQELSGSTFSISNMGMLNVDVFSAIINQPNAAIVAVATARKTVVVNEQDELEVRTRMNLTGSFDHRVVDGAVGARFMNVVRDLLHAPTRLLS